MSSYTPNENREPGPIRCAIYARFSSDNQKDTSIEDQVRNCLEFAEKMGWVVLPEYIRSDEGISGALLRSREGLQKHLADAKKGNAPFDCILMDTTARYAREVSDALKLSKIFHHNNVFLYFVAEGLDTRTPYSRTLQMFYGMKDEHDLEILRHNVHRGLTGVAKKGYSTGGTHYGYRNDLVLHPTAKDEYGRPAVDHSVWKKNEEQAAIVMEAFNLRALGTSHTDITKHLNKNMIAGPSGKGWSYATVRRMLSDPTYIGIKKWNTTKRERDPDTEKIRASKRPQSEWVVNEIPELRIVPQELWEKVQEVNLFARSNRQKLGGMNRTTKTKKYLFSGPLKCGVCGGAMVVVGGKGANKYGCRAHRQEGLCTNSVTIRRDTLEEQLLDAITAKLQPVALGGFVQSYKTRIEEYLARESDHGDHNRDDLERRLAEKKKELANITRAIASRPESEALLEELTSIESEVMQTRELLRQVTNTVPARPTFEEFEVFVHQRADDLKSVLRGDPVIAKSAIARFIRRLVLTPVESPDGHVFEVAGDIDLFATDPGVMLGSAVERSDRHYTPLLSLVGVRLDPNRQVQASVTDSHDASVFPPLTGTETAPNGAQFPGAA
jgi:site-specific DNA recombinase